MDFKNIYIQAREGRKNGREYKISTDTPLKRTDYLTHAVTVPKEVNTELDFVVYNLHAKITLAKIDLDFQKLMMKSVFAACVRFAGVKRIHSISYSFDPEDIKDCVILIKFLLQDGEEGPPSHVVLDRIGKLTSEKMEGINFDVPLLE